MPEFKVEAPFQPTGDQPEAIIKLVEGIRNDYRYQTLLGVTGSGKTYTALAAVRQWIFRPTYLNGEPVEVETQITVNFTLSGG